MKIAIEGCAHGELEKIYETIHCLEEKEGYKIDLLICCGDFQAARNEEDLHCMAIPPKYHNICTFYKYYNGEKVAPFLTIFIGGNHEASNFLQELPYGGWVAPNIYFLGYAGVVNVGGIRIGGISGIYKSQDYMKGRHEVCPYGENTKRSVYHIRNLDILRLKQLEGSVNIFLSHDWPSGIWNYGNKEQLLRFKPFFEQDMETGRLGSKPAEELLKKIKPDYWFSAHLHCKFAALVKHENGKETKFLALDKCLPKRRFLQVIDIEHESDVKMDLSYDLEWLTILRSTNHLLSVKNVTNYLPGPNSNERWIFTPSDEEKQITLSKLDNNLLIPCNFEKTGQVYNKNSSNRIIRQPLAVSNPQTVLLCKKLEIDDPVELLLNLSASINITADNDSLQNEEETTKSFINDTSQSLKESTFPSFKINNELEEPNKLKSDDMPEVKKFKRRNASMYESELN